VLIVPAAHVSVMPQASTSTITSLGRGQSAWICSILAITSGTLGKRLARFTFRPAHESRAEETAVVPNLRPPGVDRTGANHDLGHGAEY
jgi:hypothetical protein